MALGMRNGRPFRFNRLIQVSALACLLLYASSEPSVGETDSQNTHSAAEFIFSGRSVTGAQNPRAFLNLNDRISVGEINERFSDYKVSIGQCEFPFCLIVEGAKSLSGNLL